VSRDFSDLNFITTLHLTEWLRAKESGPETLGLGKNLEEHVIHLQQLLQLQDRDKWQGKDNVITVLICVSTSKCFFSLR
jgi:hypothetical protein